MDYLPTQGAFVLYKGQPAFIRNVDQKIIIELRDNKEKTVRVKDIEIVHPGPLSSLANLLEEAPQDLEENLALLREEENSSLEDWCQLLFGSFTPSSVWSLLQMLRRREYIKGTLDNILIVTPEERQQKIETEKLNQEKEEKWQAFIQRLKEDKPLDTDSEFFQDLENLALGKSKKSKILTALNQKQLPDIAYHLLLKWNIWDETMNSFLLGSDFAMAPPSLPTLSLSEENRLDLRHLASYAIDDAFTNDPDDAMSIEIRDGRPVLWVHIADVGALAPLDSSLDNLAKARLSSIYLPEKNIPMLAPEVVSILGLGINEESPAFSLAITLKDDGDIENVTIHKTWIRAKRLTYEDVAHHFDDFPDLISIYDLTKQFGQFRKIQGALHIQMPEFKLSVDSDNLVSVKMIEPLFSRQLVAESMLMAGYAAAFFAKKNKIPLVYVIQPTPEVPFKITPQLSSQYAARRYFKRSTMSMIRGPHGGLGLPFYTRITSPLRRYCDLIVMQQLRLFLNQETLLTQDELVAKMGLYEASIGDIIQLQRASERHWKLVYLQNIGLGNSVMAILLSLEGGMGTFYIKEIGFEFKMHCSALLEVDKEYSLAIDSIQISKQNASFSLVLD